MTETKTPGARAARWRRTSRVSRPALLPMTLAAAAGPRPPSPSCCPTPLHEEGPRSRGLTAPQAATPARHERPQPRDFRPTLPRPPTAAAAAAARVRSLIPPIPLFHPLSVSPLRPCRGAQRAHALDQGGAGQVSGLALRAWQAGRLGRQWAHGAAHGVLGLARALRQRASSPRPAGLRPPWSRAAASWTPSRAPS